MTALTAAVAILGLIAVLSVRPGRAIGVLVAAMLIYPDYLRVPIGPAQMSVSRVVAIALLLRMLGRPERSLFDWCWADVLVIGLYFWNLFANVMHGVDSARLIWLLGNGLDTAVVYFCARLALNTNEARRDALLPLCLVLIYLGTLGVLEATLQWRPYNRFMAYHSWQWFDKPLEFRLGLLRAQVSTSHAIYFGVSMFVVTTLVASFASVAQRSNLIVLGLVCGALGTFSSLSSGPQLSMIIFVGVSLLYFRTEYIKPLLWTVLGMAVMLEILSDRRFYHLVDYLNIAGGTSWYRNKLMEVAFTQLPEYWLFGHGSEHPHHWGKLIDGRPIVDIVNHYVLLAVGGGLLAMLGYIAVQVLCLKESIRAWSESGFRTRRMAYIQAAALLGVVFGSLAVSMYAPAISLVHLLLGSMARQPRDEEDEFERFGGFDAAFDDDYDEYAETATSPAYSADDKRA